MPNYEFQSTLYRTRSDMLDAIAYSWASANGSVSELQDSLDTMTDEALAIGCISGWELDRPDDDSDTESRSHMEYNGYDAADLTSAFADLREQLPEIIAENS